MNYARLFIVLTAIIMSISVISASWALEEGEEEAYGKAMILLEEERPGEARNVFQELAKDNPSDFKIQLGLINADIEEARILKASDIDTWEGMIYSAFGQLKRLFPKHTSSPEIYLSFAKCYWVNNRPHKALRSLKKAFYYNPNYAEAYMFQGDMSLAEDKRMKRRKSSDDTTNVLMNISSYNHQVENSYKTVLIQTGIDDRMKAQAHFKLGIFYAYSNLSDKAKEQMRKAVSLDPDGYWGKKAQEKLNEL